MNNRYLYKAKKKNWRELPTEEQWVVGYIVHRPTGEWQILRKCDNPPDGDPMWRKVLITYEIDPSTICQCTGLKDKNGKLIWENDVTLRTSVTGTYKGKIFYGAEGAFCQKDFETLFENLLLNSESYFEVIGNIFDNPELLEVEE